MEREKEDGDGDRGDEEGTWRAERDMERGDEDGEGKLRWRKEMGEGR